MREMLRPYSLSSLTYLNLENNKITDTIAKDLLLALKTHKSLKKLNLSNNMIGEESAMALRTFLLENDSVAELYLH